jgi:hypothetical protein
MDEQIWFQGKRTIRPDVNVNPIISHLVVILQIPNQMWIIMEENLRLVLLCDPKNLGVLGAPRAKPFAKLTFLPLVAWDIPYVNLKNTYHKST